MQFVNCNLIILVLFHLNSSRINQLISVLTVHNFSFNQTLTMLIFRNIIQKGYFVHFVICFISCHLSIPVVFHSDTIGFTSFNMHLYFL